MPPLLSRLIFESWPAALRIKAVPKIHILPAVLVNKIAAGEVIERPASLVKELVENALDAGSTRIDVVVEDGGKRLIAVTDNGSGMSAEDLAMAFLPHATSKISDDDDLFAIHTMGFRGEALASIAAVSHAQIRTGRRTPATSGEPNDADKQAGRNVSLPVGAVGPSSVEYSGKLTSPDEKDDSTDADEMPSVVKEEKRNSEAPGGYQIEASGEEVGPVVPCAAAAGTTVTIRDLFFNTPGRRKFLKTAATELGHITEQMTRLALPHPQVAFSLTHNGKVVQNFPAAGSTMQRAADIFGRELADALLPIVNRHGRGVSVAGLAAKPAASRGSGSWQYFFLNGRYIRDRLLGHALREAYRGLADPNRFPVAVVFLQVDPAEVDVNVHPTKIEVRFRDGQAVHGELLAALRETLNRANLSPRVTLSPAAAQGNAVGAATDDAASASLDSAADKLATDPNRQQSLRQAMADFFKSAPSPQPRFQFGEPAPSHGFDRGPQDRDSRTGFSPLPPQEETDAKPQAEETLTVAAESEHGAVLSDVLPTAVQFHNSYIVTFCEDGLEIIDQHALHERIIYNELKRRLTEGPVECQRLLIPQTLSVTPAEAASLEENAELLSKLGFDLAAFGPQTVAIQAVPGLLTRRGIDAPQVVREILDRLAQGSAADGESVLESLLETMACKAAVKAGDPLNPAEIQALLARRNDQDKCSACPHGRPTTLKLSLKDLLKQFKRT
jgi:DNA mismatch repair protein MutL